jgi:urease accessory protein
MLEGAMTVDLPWRVLQVADSAFPAGGFAHSAGLEAAVHVGHVGSAEDLDAYVHAHLWNTGRASLPFVGAAYDLPRAVWALDARLDAQLTSHVANRASRTQGRAFLATCARVFDESAIAALGARAASREVAAHLAVSFGAVLAALCVARRQALGLYLLLALRSVASAAVRLGIVGPHEAQRVQRRHGPTLDAVLAECEALRPAQAASVAPLLDVFGATHDRLYARLFQS